MAICYIETNTFLGQFTSSACVVPIEDATSIISLAKSLAFCLDLCFLSFALPFVLYTIITIKLASFCLPIEPEQTIPFLLYWFLKFTMMSQACTLTIDMDLLVKQITKKT
jgi:hypothetical protein